MIFESYPWKKEIERLLESLRKWSSNLHSRRAEFYIQRAIFFSAFAMRKLMENRKMTDALRDKSIRCKAYPSLQSVSNRISTFAGLADVSEDYDLTRPEEVTLGCFDLMSEIMHSYVFKIVLDDDEQDRMVSFLVNSYNKRDNRLLEIDLLTFEDVLNHAVHDRVNEMIVRVHPTSEKIIAEVRGQKERD
jgi:hypothetical protein